MMSFELGHHSLWLTIRFIFQSTNRFAFVVSAFDRFTHRETNQRMPVGNCFSLNAQQLFVFAALDRERKLCCWFYHMECAVLVQLSTRIDFCFIYLWRHWSATKIAPKCFSSAAKLFLFTCYLRCFQQLFVSPLWCFDTLLIHKSWACRRNKRCRVVH